MHFETENTFWLRPFQNELKCLIGIVPGSKGSMFYLSGFSLFEIFMINSRIYAKFGFLLSSSERPQPTPEQGTGKTPLLKQKKTGF